MIRSFVLRNLTLFFRDKAAVFFSLLSPLILFVLYIFFLGEVQVKSLIENTPGVAEADIRLFMNSWVFSGIIAISTITTSLAGIGIFVQDRVSGRFRDFAVSPAPRWKIVLSYLISTFITSFAISLVVLVVSHVYLMIASGADLPTWAYIGDILWRVALLTVTFSALASLVVAFIKSDSVFTSVNVIAGTVIGFLAGVYVPVGVLPNGVASTVNALPFSQATVLIREPMAGPAIEAMDTNKETKDALYTSYGVDIKIGENKVAESTILTVLVFITLVSLAAGIVRTARVVRE